KPESERCKRLAERAGGAALADAFLAGDSSLATVATYDPESLPADHAAAPRRQAGARLARVAKFARSAPRPCARRGRAAAGRSIRGRILAGAGTPAGTDWRFPL